MSGNDYIHWKRWDTKEFGLPDAGESFYFDRLFKRMLKAKSHILEIGFGNGELLGYFKTLGHSVVGVEIQDELVAEAAKKGFTAFSGLVSKIPELQTDRFDLIVACDVVEHLTYDELTTLFRWMKGHLDPNGRVLLRFPEGASPLALANYNGDFTHKTFFTKDKMQNLCIANGLILDRYFDDLISSNKLCSLGLFGKFLLMVLQSYSWFLMRVLRIIFYPIEWKLRMGTNSIAVIRG